MTIQIDITEGTTINHDADGYSLDRMAIVTGVTGSANARIYNAVNDAGLPSLGDAHPTITDIYLNNKRGDALEPEVVQVTLSYSSIRGYPGTTNTLKSASASTSPQTVTADKDGTDMFALYQTDADFAKVPPVATKENFRISIESPRAQFEFEYTIDDSPLATAFPNALIDTYLGKVNSVAWNGYGVRTILCTAINITQQGAGYRVGISFMYNPDLWEYNAVIAVPTSDLESTYTSDPTLDYGTGIKNFKVYKEVSFAALGLTL